LASSTTWQSGRTFGAFDLHQLERVNRQRQERRSFLGRKDREWRAASGAVITSTSPFHDPLAQRGVGGVQIGELLASQEAAFGEVHAAFHLAFGVSRQLHRVSQV